MAEVNKKPNIFVRMGTGLSRWFREMKSELKKVVWPSKEDVKTNTIVVLVTVAIAAVVMILLDAIFGGILGLIIGA